MNKTRIPLDTRLLIARAYRWWE